MLLLIINTYIAQPDTFVETVHTCGSLSFFCECAFRGLEFFLKLHTDVEAPIRRFGAQFIERLLLSKPQPQALSCFIHITKLIVKHIVKQVSIRINIIISII